MKIHLSTTWQIILTIVLALSMAGLGTHSAQAGTAVCMVTTGADGTSTVPSGSLREMIANSNCSDIRFQAGYNISLAAVLPDLNRQVTLNDDNNLVYINGEGLDQVFHITADGDVTMYNMVINSIDSAGNKGRGIYNEGKLSIHALSFYDTGGSSGAAIFSKNELEVYISEFDSNEADSAGGAIAALNTLYVDSSTFLNNAATTLDGGAIAYWGGDATIVNSTFSGNSAGGKGGAIFHSIGTLNVFNSTFSNNYAGDKGAGIFTEASTGLTNTILANNTVRSTPGNCSGTITDGGGNLSWLDSDATCPASFAQLDPLLAPPAKYGSETGLWTMPLLPGSAAIDHGIYSVCMNDPVEWRGRARP